MLLGVVSSEICEHAVMMPSMSFFLSSVCLVASSNYLLLEGVGSSTGHEYCVHLPSPKMQNSSQTVHQSCPGNYGKARYQKIRLNELSITLVSDPEFMHSEGSYGEIPKIPRNSRNVAKFRKCSEIPGMSRNSGNVAEFLEFREPSRNSRNSATFTEILHVLRAVLHACWVCASL